MIVSFFLDNENHKGVDYSNPHLGNPGIGGTQYMFWIVAYYLQKFYKDIEINLIAPYIDTMPENIKSYKAGNIYEAIKIAKNLNSDIVVLRGPQNNAKLFDIINKYKINTIFWSHNFENWQFAELAAKNKYVKRNICVGKEQLDRLRDHDIFKKSTYIYNALDFDIYNPYSYGKKEEKIVSYMGSLTKRKGFHKLAKNWKRISRRVPDAKLYVLGGGDLYGKEWINGEYNLTNPGYEKKLIKYLMNKDGKLMNNVEFKGVVSGQEKLSLLEKTRVGIANPTGVGETFCIVAAEYQAVGTPVVTIKRNGLLDTVENKKSGLLFKNDREFVRSVVTLLNNQNLVSEYGNYGIDMVRQKFNIESICKQWHNILIDIRDEKHNEVNYESKNWSNDYKWLREINRKIKLSKSLKWIPSILWYELVLHDIYVKFRDVKSKHFRR